MSRQHLRIDILNEKSQSINANIQKYYCKNKNQRIAKKSIQSSAKGKNEAKIQVKRRLIQRYISCIKYQLTLYQLKHI
jgi:uncharacterized protein YlaI